LDHDSEIWDWENEKDSGTKRTDDSLASLMTSMASSACELIDLAWPFWYGLYPEVLFSQP
jgi:hypothetical protein